MSTITTPPPAPTPPYQLWKTREQKAALEARNGLLLFRDIEARIASAKSGFSLTPQVMFDLHKLAIQDIYTCAGSGFRNGWVGISGTMHQPPDWPAVPAHVDEMCAYVNDNFGMSALHLAAYVMWRHNWIHPFFGGNGRTSRGLSYLVLGARLGFVLPGPNTIPQQIVNQRDLYVAGLRAADIAYSQGQIEVSQMEALLSDMLAAQLYSVYKQAGGTEAS